MALDLFSLSLVKTVWAQWLDIPFVEMVEKEPRSPWRHPCGDEMSIAFTEKEITEAEIEIATEIAVLVIDFLKAQENKLWHEAIMRRIEMKMRDKALPPKARHTPAGEGGSR